MDTLLYYIFLYSAEKQPDTYSKIGLLQRTVQYQYIVEEYGMYLETSPLDISSHHGWRYYNINSLKLGIEINRKSIPIDGSAMDVNSLVVDSLLDASVLDSKLTADDGALTEKTVVCVVVVAGEVGVVESVPGKVVEEEVPTFSNYN